MKKIKILSAPFFVALPLMAPQIAYGMDGASLDEEQKKGTGMQLAKGANDTLEAPLGMGNNVLLKMSMNLEAFKIPLDQEQVEVPMRIFLTDFTSLPTTHPAVNFAVKVDCGSKNPTCTLPEKPSSFDSYRHFTNWLNQGYLTNQINITYDFQVDVQKLAPSLAQYINFIPPGGYRFIGTHVVDNEKMTPDDCIPKVTYLSEKGNVNKTLTTLGGILYLNKKPYPVEDYQQIFPHRMVEEKILKRDTSKKFYQHQWLAQSEITSMLTYEEFPKQQVQDWPNVPSNTYSVVHKKPGDKDSIMQLLCMDGGTGEKVNISDGKVFLMDCEAGMEGNVITSIVKDADDNLYIMKYRNLDGELRKEAAEQARIAEKQEREKREKLRQEAQKRAREAEEQEREKQERDKQERLVLLSSEIETVMNTYNALRKDKLTYNELAKLLESIYNTTGKKSGKTVKVTQSHGYLTIEISQMRGNPYREILYSQANNVVDYNNHVRLEEYKTYDWLDKKEGKKDGWERLYETNTRHVIRTAFSDLKSNINFYFSNYKREKGEDHPLYEQFNAGENF